MNGILVSLFKYKAWANQEMHATLAEVDVRQHAAEFQAMLHTLDHANAVDRIFQAHLRGTSEPRFKATNSEEVPGLSKLRDTVTATDEWYLQFVSGIGPEELQQRIEFTFTDGEQGAMSREEMLLHVITHSGYHRGSVGQTLENLGMHSPPDSLTKFLHRHEPERRLRAETE